MSDFRRYSHTVAGKVKKETDFHDWFKITDRAHKTFRVAMSFSRTFAKHTVAGFDPSNWYRCYDLYRIAALDTEIARMNRCLGNYSVAYG